MKVLVTGGTGFIGREVVRQLAVAGHKPTLLVRNPKSVAAQEAASDCGGDLRTGDVLRPDTLRSAVQGTEAIVHLVGIIAEVGENTFENTHARATRDLVAAAQSAGVQRFVHMSALGTRPNGRSRYHQTKWAAEQAVRASGLAGTIIRPSLVFGPHDHFVNMYAGIVRRSPVVPLVGRRAALFQPVAVEDVAKAFVQSLGRDRGGECASYDLCGPERFTMDEIVSTILRVMNRKRIRLHIPAGLAWAQAGFLQWFFPKVLRKASPLSRDQLLMLEEDNIGDPGPARRDLGIEGQSFEPGIARYLKT